MSCQMTPRTLRWVWCIVVVAASLLVPSTSLLGAAAAAASAAKMGDPSEPFAAEIAFTAGHVRKHHANVRYEPPACKSGALHVPTPRLAFLEPATELGGSELEGYERVLARPRSFTHLAPRWFRAALLRRNNNNKKGGPDDETVSPFVVKAVAPNVVNTTWMAKVRELTDGGTRIVPVVHVPLNADFISSDVARSTQLARAVADRVAGKGQGASKSSKDDDVRANAGLVSGVIIDFGNSRSAAARLHTSAEAREHVRVFLRLVRQALSDALEEDDVIVGLVLRPDADGLTADRGSWAVRDVVDDVLPDVDLLSLALYNRSAASERPRETASYPWVRDTLQALLGPSSSSSSSSSSLDAERRKKLLLGVPLFGLRFTGELQPPTKVTGREYVRVLEQARDRRAWTLAAEAEDKAGSSNAGASPVTTAAGAAKAKKKKKEHEQELDRTPEISWGTESREHVVETYVPKRGVAWIFYPSIASIALRVDLAARLGIGVAADDVGAGLAYFLSLFNPR